MSERYQDRYHDSGISDEEIQQRYRDEQLAKVDRWKAEYNEKRERAVAMAKDKAKTADANVCVSKSIIHPYVKFSLLILLLLGSLFICGLALLLLVECIVDGYALDDYLSALLFLVPSSIILTLCLRSLKKVYRQVLHIYQMRYKERCYKRINRIHGYYESGSITQEEFESMKREILSKIEQK